MNYADENTDQTVHRTGFSWAKADFLVGTRVRQFGTAIKGTIVTGLPEHDGTNLVSVQWDNMPVGDIECAHIAELRRA